MFVTVTEFKINFGKYLEMIANEDVISAYLKKAHDFEDCLLATCAKANNCSYIVTRNKVDFLAFDVPLLSPEELLRKIK